MQFDIGHFDYVVQNFSSIFKSDEECNSFFHNQLQINDTDDDVVSKHIRNVCGVYHTLTNVMHNYMPRGMCEGDYIIAVIIIV